MQARQAGKLSSLILLITAVIQVPIETTRAYKRPIYAASGWYNYLRAVTVKDDSGWVPVLYSERGSHAAGIRKFEELCDGTPIHVSSDRIGELYQERCLRADTIVVSRRADMSVL